ncbi:MAG: hypothetical protein GXO79_14885 [Chlorobi bacterium]|nr:hypothetical protein [Chlorobiota bacterium]
MIETREQEYHYKIKTKQMLNLKFKKMKAIQYMLIIILFLVSIPQFSNAKTKDDFTKQFRETYEANVNTLLKISNKFGDVNLEDWDKDEVIINVTIKVKTESEERANKVFDRINIYISNNDNVISAVTEIDDKINANGNFSIDYSVKAPQYIQLELKNKFGNVYINDLSGKVNLNVSYGNLMINRLLRTDENPLNEINLAYCNKASIAEMAKAKVIIKYSKLDLLNTDKLLLFSKYSKIIIENAKSLVTEAAYDSYKLDNIDNFSSVGKYTDYSIKKVTNSINIETKFGNFNVDYISPEFKNIKSESKYGKVHLGIASNASYRISAHVEYGGIDYPSSDKLSRIKDGSEITLNGIIGENKAPKSNVIIEAKYGSVNLER